MAKDTELAEEQSKELYELVAQKFDLCCIGAQEPNAIKAFREDPGTGPLRKNTRPHARANAGRHRLGARAESESAMPRPRSKLGLDIFSY